MSDRNNQSSDLPKFMDPDRMTQLFLEGYVFTLKTEPLIKRVLRLYILECLPERDLESQEKLDLVSGAIETFEAVGHKYLERDTYLATLMMMKQGAGKFVEELGLEDFITDTESERYQPALI